MSRVSVLAGRCAISRDKLAPAESATFSFSGICRAPLRCSPTPIMDQRLGQINIYQDVKRPGQHSVQRKCSVGKRCQADKSFEVGLSMQR